MSEYEHAQIIKVNGIVFRSRAEAGWFSLFSKLGFGPQYEPTTFNFPDGSTYRPDVFIPRSRRHIEVKNEDDQVKEKDLMLINQLARFICSQTVLINGSATNKSKDPTVMWFDGQEPLSDESIPLEYRYAAGVHYRLKPGNVVNLALQQDFRAERHQRIINVGRVNGMAKGLALDLDPIVSDAEKTSLITKFQDPAHQVVNFTHETDEILAYLAGLPPRKIPDSILQLSSISLSDFMSDDTPY